MATFRAPKRFHFSDDGIDPWAEFVLVPDSDPAVYEFDTDDPEAIGRLESVDEVTRVDGSTDPAAEGAATSDGGLEAWLAAEAQYQEDVAAWLAAEEQQGQGASPAGRKAGSR